MSTLSLWHRYTLSPGSLAKHVPSISSKPRSILVGNNLSARIRRTRVHRTRFSSRTLLGILIIKDLRRRILRFIIASFLRHRSARRPTTVQALTMSHVFRPVLITSQLASIYLPLSTHSTLDRSLSRPSFVLRLILLQLPFPQQGVYLAMSEDADLLICQGALHAIGVIAEVVFVGVELVFNGFGRWRVQRLVGAREVGCLEGLEVFLCSSLSVPWDTRLRHEEILLE